MPDLDLAEIVKMVAEVNRRADARGAPRAFRHVALHVDLALRIVERMELLEEVAIEAAFVVAGDNKKLLAIALDKLDALRAGREAPRQETGARARVRLRDDPPTKETP